MNRSVRADVYHMVPSSDDESRIVAELRRLKSQRSFRDLRIAMALQALQQTSSARIRNAAALALADMKAHDAKDSLVALLADSATKGARGTLLYALEQLGEAIPLSILIMIITDDSYEAREEALFFLAKGRFDCSSKELETVRAKLEALTTSTTDEERLQAVHRALDYLDQNPQLCERSADLKT